LAVAGSALHEGGTERTIHLFLSMQKREDAYEAAVPEVVTVTSPNLLTFVEKGTHLVERQREQMWALILQRSRTTYTTARRRIYWLP
jgi:hypothetical protein